MLSVWDLHFIGPVDAVLAGKAGGPGAYGSSRTARLISFLLIASLLLELLSLVADEGHRRGHEVHITELGVVDVVLDLGGDSRLFLMMLLLESGPFEIVVFAFGSITILANQGPATPEDSEASRGTALLVVLVLTDNLLAYQVALHVG